MKLHSLKRTMMVSAFGLAALFGTNGIANAQNNRQVQQKPQKVERQQQKIERQQQRVEQQQQRVGNQRQQIYSQRQQINNQRQNIEQQRIELAQQQREQQIRLEQQRQEQLRIQNQRNRNVYANNNNRYRVYRNGGYYQTDNRGAELLRQAVNNGYQQGVRAGQQDRSSRRGSNYYNSSIYRSGNYGYQSYVDSSQYQYYFQQGFERGYQDGYNSRYQYGSNNNGGLNILGSILSGILNIQQY